MSVTRQQCYAQGGNVVRTGPNYTYGVQEFCLFPGGFLEPVIEYQPIIYNPVIYNPYPYYPVYNRQYPHYNNWNQHGHHNDNGHHHNNHGKFVQGLNKPFRG